MGRRRIVYTYSLYRRIPGLGRADYAAMGTSYPAHAHYYAVRNLGEWRMGSASRNDSERGNVLGCDCDYHDGLVGHAPLGRCGRRVHHSRRRRAAVRFQQSTLGRPDADVWVGADGGLYTRAGGGTRGDPAGASWGGVCRTALVIHHGRRACRPGVGRWDLYSARLVGPRAATYALRGRGHARW